MNTKTGDDAVDRLIESRQAQARLPSVQLREALTKLHIVPSKWSFGDQHKAALTYSERSDGEWLSMRLELALEHAGKGKVQAMRGTGKTSGMLSRKKILSLNHDTHKLVAKNLKVSSDWLTHGVLQDESKKPVYESQVWKSAEEINDSDSVHWERLVERGTVPAFLLPYLQGYCAIEHLTRWIGSTILGVSDKVGAEGSANTGYDYRRFVWTTYNTFVLRLLETITADPSGAMAHSWSLSFSLAVEPLITSMFMLNPGKELIEVPVTLRKCQIDWIVTQMKNVPGWPHAHNDESMLKDLFVRLRRSERSAKKKRAPSRRDGVGRKKRTKAE